MITKQQNLPEACLKIFFETKTFIGFTMCDILFLDLTPLYPSNYFVTFMENEVFSLENSVRADKYDS